MILIINTIKREEIIIGLYRDRTLEWFEFETGDQSADILSNIEKTLKSQKTSLQDITAIVVNQGPGSFTGVRVGIAVANALAWGLNIPVVGYKDGDVEESIAKIKDKHFFKIVLPYYPKTIKK